MNSVQEKIKLTSRVSDLEKANEELIKLIKELEDKWISASHYWGSYTNKKVDAIIKLLTAPKGE